MERPRNDEPRQSSKGATPKDAGESESLDRAAPPDDGGHTGSFTQPDDVMETGGDPAGERRPRRAAPELHWSPRTDAQRRPSDEPPEQ